MLAPPAPQVVLILSGNLSFLNWLTIVPSLACFDDASLGFLFPSGPAGLKDRVLKLQDEDAQGHQPRPRHTGRTQQGQLHAGRPQGSHSSEGQGPGSWEGLWMENGRPAGVSLGLLEPGGQQPGVWGTSQGDTAALS